MKCFKYLALPNLFFRRREKYLSLFKRNQYSTFIYKFTLLKSMFLPLFLGFRFQYRINIPPNIILLDQKTTRGRYNHNIPYYDEQCHEQKQTPYNIPKRWPICRIWEKCCYEECQHIKCTADWRSTRTPSTASHNLFHSFSDRLYDSMLVVVTILVLPIALRRINEPEVSGFLNKEFNSIRVDRWNERRWCFFLLYLHR